MQTINIRKQFLRFTAAATLAIALFACQKDPAPSPGPSPSAAKLKEYRNGEDFIRLNYGTDGTVNKVTVKSTANTGDDVIEYAVTYNAQKKITKLESNAGISIVPVYENNVLRRADQLLNNERVGYTNYHYENGKLKKVTIYFGQDPDYVPMLDYNFEYDAAGNLRETVALVFNGTPGQLVRSGHVTYQYDQKNSPLVQYKDLLELFWQVATPNNVLVEDHFDSDLQLEDRYTYTYTYKNNGLPEKATVKIGLPGQPTTTSQVQYTYQ